VSSQTVAAFFDYLGAGRRPLQRRIPDAVLRSPKSMVMAFLSGLALDANETSSPAPEWSFSASSVGLLDDLQAALTNLGLVHSRKGNRIHTTGVHTRRVEFSPVETVRDAGECEVFDVSVPVTHAFVGNGIVNHNTINLPNDATEADIGRAYRLGWERGLKAVALYRDGCKMSQPLSSGSDAGSDGAGDAAGADAASQDEQLALTDAITATMGWNPFRRKLPAKRYGWTQEATIGGQKIYLRVGEYEDGTIGELFIDMNKEGATLRSLMNCFAIAVSKGLQYGVPLEEFVDTFVYHQFEPRGIVQGHPNVKMASSVIDYVFRVLGIEYLGREDLAHVKPSELDAPSPPPGSAPLLDVSAAAVSAQAGEITPPAGAAAAPVPAGVAPASTVLRGNASPVPAQPAPDSLNTQMSQMMGDAPCCTVCGHLTVRNGSCYRCLNCGTSMGCS
jgi:hypothetical protein